MSAEPSDPPRSDSIAARIRRHWLITTLFVVATIAGTVLGVLYLPEEMGLVRRVVGGAISGAGVAFLITATKMLN